MSRMFTVGNLRRAFAVSVIAGICVVTGIPAGAVVDVEGVHGEYDSCIAKFTGAGLRDEVNQLDQSSHKFVVEKAGKAYTKTDATDAADARNGVGTGATITWWPSPSAVFQDGVAEDGCATLYHEMYHATDDDKGTLNDGNCIYVVDGTKIDTGIPIKEVNAVRAENRYRHALGLPQRTKFGSLSMPPPDAQCQPTPPPPPRSSGGCNVSAVGCPTGSSFGDPQVVSYNGYRFPFQAAGEFVLTQSTDRFFEVQVRSVPVPGHDNLTLNTAAAIKFGPHHLTFYEQAKPDDDSHSLRFDGHPMSTSTGEAVALPGGGSILFSGNDVILESPSGERVTLHPASMQAFQFINVSVAIPPAKRGDYIGILGNGNATTTGDLRTRDGKSITLANAYGDIATRLGLARGLPNANTAFRIFLNRTFADSWRVGSQESLFEYTQGYSTQTFTDRSYPRSDFTASSSSAQGAVQSCRGAGVSDAFLVGCVYDVSATGSNVFATAVAHAQSLLRLSMPEPSLDMRSLLPTLPRLPSLPTIPFPY